MPATSPIPTNDEPLAASLAALNEADRASFAGGSPRQLLSRVEPAWQDDLSAWRLAQRFVRFTREKARETTAAGSPVERARARWAYGVALDLYEELRLRALAVRHTETMGARRNSLSE
jgi:hypothetical protein